MFDEFDFSDFWEESDYSAKHYVSDPPTDELIAEIEQEPDRSGLPETQG